MSKYSSNVEVAPPNTRDADTLRISTFEHTASNDRSNFREELSGDGQTSNADSILCPEPQGELSLNAPGGTPSEWSPTQIHIELENIDPLKQLNEVVRDATSNLFERAINEGFSFSETDLRNVLNKITTKWSGGFEIDPESLEQAFIEAQQTLVGCATETQSEVLKQLVAEVLKTNAAGNLRPGPPGHTGIDPGQLKKIIETYLPAGPSFIYAQEVNRRLEEEARIQASHLAGEISTWLKVNFSNDLKSLGEDKLSPDEMLEGIRTLQASALSGLPDSQTLNNKLLSIGRILPEGTPIFLIEQEVIKLARKEALKNLRKNFALNDTELDSNKRYGEWALLFERESQPREAIQNLKILQTLNLHEDDLFELRRQNSLIVQLLSHELQEVEQNLCKIDQVIVRIEAGEAIPDLAVQKDRLDQGVYVEVGQDISVALLVQRAFELEDSSQIKEIHLDLLLAHNPHLAEPIEEVKKLLRSQRAFTQNSSSNPTSAKAIFEAGIISPASEAVEIDLSHTPVGLSLELLRIEGEQLTALHSRPLIERVPEHLPFVAFQGEILTEQGYFHLRVALDALNDQQRMTQFELLTLRALSGAREGTACFDEMLQILRQEEVFLQKLTQDYRDDGVDPARDQRAQDQITSYQEKIDTLHEKLTLTVIHLLRCENASSSLAYYLLNSADLEAEQQLGVIEQLIALRISEIEVDSTSSEQSMLATRATGLSTLITELKGLSVTNSNTLDAAAMQELGKHILALEQRQQEIAAELAYSAQDYQTAYQGIATLTAQAIGYDSTDQFLQALQGEDTNSILQSISERQSTEDDPGYSEIVFELLERLNSIALDSGTAQVKGCQTMLEVMDSIAGTNSSLDARVLLARSRFRFQIDQEEPKELEALARRTARRVDELELQLREYKDGVLPEEQKACMELCEELEEARKLSVEISATRITILSNLAVIHRGDDELRTQYLDRLEEAHTASEEADRKAIEQLEQRNKELQVQIEEILNAQDDSTEVELQLNQEEREYQLDVLKARRTVTRALLDIAEIYIARHPDARDPERLKELLQQDIQSLQQDTYTDPLEDGAGGRAEYLRNLEALLTYAKTCDEGSVVRLLHKDREAISAETLNLTLEHPSVVVLKLQEEKQWNQEKILQHHQSIVALRFQQAVAAVQASDGARAGTILKELQHDYGDKAFDFDLKQLNETRDSKPKQLKIDGITEQIAQFYIDNGNLAFVASVQEFLNTMQSDSLWVEIGMPVGGGATGAAAGAAVGTFLMPGVGTAAGAGAGFMIGLAAGTFAAKSYNLYFGWGRIRGAAQTSLTPLSGKQTGFDLAFAALDLVQLASVTKGLKPLVQLVDRKSLSAAAGALAEEFPELGTKLSGDLLQRELTNLATRNMAGFGGKWAGIGGASVIAASLLDAVGEIETSDLNDDQKEMAYRTMRTQLLQAAIFFALNAGAEKFATRSAYQSLRQVKRFRGSLNELHEADIKALSEQVQDFASSFLANPKNAGTPGSFPAKKRVRAGEDPEDYFAQYLRLVVARGEVILGGHRLGGEAIQENFTATVRNNLDGKEIAIHDLYQSVIFTYHVIDELGLELEPIALSNGAVLRGPSPEMWHGQYTESNFVKAAKPVPIFEVTPDSLRSIPINNAANSTSLAWEHPQFRRDVQRMRELGYSVVVDPTNYALSIGGCFSADSKYINLMPDAPYHVFAHEFTHLVFHREVLRMDLFKIHDLLDSAYRKGFWATQESSPVKLLTDPEFAQETGKQLRALGISDDICNGLDDLSGYEVIDFLSSRLTERELALANEHMPSVGHLILKHNERGTDALLKFATEPEHLPGAKPRPGKSTEAITRKGIELIDTLIGYGMSERYIDELAEIHLMIAEACELRKQGYNEIAINETLATETEDRLFEKDGYDYFSPERVGAREYGALYRNKSNAEAALRTGATKGSSTELEEATRLVEQEGQKLFTRGRWSALNESQRAFCALLAMTGAYMLTSQETGEAEIFYRDPVSKERIQYSCRG